jgi:nucleoid-associated protein YgaU
MADKEEKKGLFGKALDAFSSKDEKKELESMETELAKAKKEAEAAKQALKSMISKNVENSQEKGLAEKEAEAAEKKIAELESKLNAMMAKDREKMLAERKQMVEERKAKLEAGMAPALITKHTVEAGETLSHVALKYYKHATPPYWQFLLEHNKEVLKGSEKNVRTGMVLDIPELPEELKD